MAASYRGADAITTVAVVGAGLIGAGWVAAYLARGFKVAVADLSSDAPAKVRAHVAAAWPALCQRGLAAGADPSAITFHRDLAEALDGVDFIQESAPERPDVKDALYAELGRLAPPDVIIASSTSGMPISRLQRPCRHPERCVLGHPFNPVHLMPLVEVGGGDQTDPAAIEMATALYTSMRKQPVQVRREIVGHIANRLTSAMFREAVALVAEGYATVEDVDRAIRFGPALKWAIQGQFTTFHTGGGEGGLRNFLRHFAPGIRQRWETMTVPDLADPSVQERLVTQVEAAHPGQSVADIARHQDDRLLELLAILD
ncbi:3-hydroxyacyl-CoA dehydrogenase NAD-binding domain-containing protein [Nitrospirillum sp. BR 11164]|uniref:3-hydroxyacyl-CoA dehydrogenase NAD-binding domain-containing protein n=1 Tax=Nitrospirillum sp. BR 11164 TaxID=3104324 RepID=UPI002AFF3B2A|nr:3-hydroxyacyl-CoA dehydrogenase NAD-binding domain-containing protein [Nitrospirillum sp. BR 11164]MEA1652852.1 3-hydroxyacyl-CoA dehydrogenase NAD-binding domain-containing protein [Nitrospirillum sp. BR 11164]